MRKAMKIESTYNVRPNLDPRALLFCARLRERRALGNPETGVFVIGFREEQRTRT